MIAENALLKSDLVAGTVYQDVISYALVFIITSDGAGTVTARYYNQVTGTFDAYTAYDYSLVWITEPTPLT